MPKLLDENSLLAIKSYIESLTASVYDGTQTYNSGDIVMYQGLLYECNTDYTTGSWSPSSWRLIKTADILEQVGDKVSRSPSTANVVYGVSSDYSETVYPLVSNAATPDSIVQRKYDGKIYAGDAGATFGTNDAVNKYYVDNLVAPNFSDAATYNVGDIVIYGTGLYKCTTAVSSAGAWTGSTNWTLTKAVVHEKVNADYSITTYAQVYGKTAGGAATMFNVGTDNSAIAGTIPIRNSNGFIYAGNIGAVFSDNDAVNKAYVDTQIANQIGSVYKIQGEETAANLNSMSKTATMDGYVYNISGTTGSTYTLNNSSGQGTLSVSTGDSVVLVWASGNWYWNKISSAIDLSGYQTALDATQMNAVNSGITATKVGNYDTHVADATIHVTSTDKTNWNNKVDRITTIPSGANGIVYGAYDTGGGISQGSYSVCAAATTGGDGTLPTYNSSGNLATTTPTSNNHAANKAYVDTAVGNCLTQAEALAILQGSNS